MGRRAMVPKYAAKSVDSTPLPHPEERPAGPRLEGWATWHHAWGHDSRRSLRSLLSMRTVLEPLLAGDHGAEARLGEHLEQQRVRHPAVHDHGGLDARIHGIDAVLDLGDH